MYHAFIRTHHITSRKKVAALRAAAKKLECYALLRSGGVPGLMYVESHQEKAAQAWVDTVHNLRYKDYQLVTPVAGVSDQATISPSQGVLEEVDTVREFAAEMDKKGLLSWWRISMGYSSDNEA